jgi:cation diffusion facilitator family transporter
MTKLLGRLFINNYENTSDPNVRKNYGTLASVVGIIINLLLAVFKLLCGILAHSVAIMADAFNNLSDSGTSVITLISFKISSRPADKEHPFGHARMEYIASMIVSFVIMLVGAELLLDSGKTLLGLSYLAMAAASLLDIFVLGLYIMFFPTVTLAAVYRIYDIQNKDKKI